MQSRLSFLAVLAVAALLAVTAWTRSWSSARDPEDLSALAPWTGSESFGKERVPDPAPALATPGVPATLVDAWRGLRTRRPFHTQDIFVSSDRSGVVVAEPPPHAAPEQIAAVLGASRCEVQRHAVGYDGWVADVLLSYDAPPDEEALAERIAELGALLYDSSYGTGYVALDEGTPFAPQAPRLDVTVGADDLHRWLFEEPTVLVPAVGGDAVSAAALLSGEASAGVYWSEPPAFAVWAIERGRPLEDFRFEGRRWCIDSDLVLGGVAGERAVLIVGRMRQVEQSAFPPLRMEEILRLAAVDEAELAQSYERNHVAAGRWSGETYRDWAPIYLSAALLDSEYGSLLNVTDQLLKGWSQHGNVEYWNFPYPRPAEMPFGDDALTSLLPGSSLTFNWNTAGVGHTVDYGHLSIFALRRTGALPVTYIPEGMEAADDSLPDLVREKEERAYAYFTGLNDVHLARVVQYAALYQLFRAFGVESEVEVRASIPAQGNEAIWSTLEQALERLIAASEDELDVQTREFGEWQREQMGSNPDAEELSEFLEFDAYGQAVGLQAVLQELYGELGEAPVKSKLVRCLAPDRLGLEDAQRAFELLAALPEVGTEEELEQTIAGLEGEDRVLLEAFFLAQHILSDEGSSLRAFIIYLAGSDALKDAYAAAFQGARSSDYIRTPSIVLSGDTTSVARLGGHNLDSLVERIAIDDSVLRGSPRFSESGILLVHPDEAAGLGLASRRLARAADPEAEVAAILKASREEAAKLPRSAQARLGIEVEQGGGGGGIKPPKDRVLAGGFADAAGGAHPSLGPREIAFVDAGERVTSDGRRFFRAATQAAKVDEVVARVRQWGLDGRDTLAITVAGDATEGEVRAFGATLRARMEGGPELLLRRGNGSRLLDVELRGAQVSEMAAITPRAGERTAPFVYEIVVRPPEKQPFSIRAFSTRALEGLKQTLKGFFGGRASEAVTPRNLHLKLSELPGLEGVEFEIHIPGDSPLDGILITEQNDARDRRAAHASAA